jgi:L-amino acid N-acyltransferase YncA
MATPSSSAIRLAAANDAEAIRAIYEPIVRSTAISFEVETPVVHEIEQRIVQTLSRWPWLVCEHGGEVVGYAYASKHRERAAYQWSVDVSIYIHDRDRRLGIGRALYTSLFRALALQGFYNAFAGITLPNPASVGLHEALGFEPVGVYRSVGFKLGAWHDVGWWRLPLRPLADDPPPPVELPTIVASAEFRAAVASGMAFLRF